MTHTVRKIVTKGHYLRNHTNPASLILPFADNVVPSTPSNTARSVSDFCTRLPFDDDSVNLLKLSAGSVLCLSYPLITAYEYLTIFSSLHAAVLANDGHSAQQKVISMED